MSANLLTIHSNTKKCTGCGITKNLDQFSTSSYDKSKKRSKCKSCVAVYNCEYNLKRKTQQKQTAVVSITANNKNVNTTVVANDVVSSRSQAAMAAITTLRDTKKIANPALINTLLDKYPDHELALVFKQLIREVIGSTTSYNIKEQITANALGLLHSTAVTGPDAFDLSGQPWEIKTNSVNSESEHKLSAAGTFNDITQEKLRDIPKYTMAVSLFVDHYLLAVATFPGSWQPFMTTLHKNYEISKAKNGRVCAAFNYSDWKNCPDLKWVVVPSASALMKYQHKLTKPMFKDLLIALDNAVNNNTNQMTSDNPRVNIKGLDDI